MNHRLVNIIIFYLIGISTILYAGENSNQLQTERLNAIYSKIDTIEKSSIDFWLRFGRDTTDGSFYTTLDDSGQNTWPKQKFLISQSRYLWTFSTYYQRHPENQEIKTICDNLYRFIVNNFFDPKARLFFSLIEEDGKKDIELKRIYDNSFAIYALSEYALTFGSDEAVDYALTCFRSFDQLTHDDINGGYEQTKIDVDSWMPEGAYKDANTHMHLLESLTRLYLVSKDEAVKVRIMELLDILLNKIIQPEYYLHPNFLNNWELVGEPTVSYGHDLQVVWLIWETAKVFKLTDNENLRKTITEMGIRSAQAGFDTEKGGYFFEGIPNGSVTNNVKSWWVQAEVLLGLWRLYKLTGDVEQISRIEKTIDWIDKYQINKRMGEWYMNIDTSGNVVDDYTFMSSFWKSNYHNLRATMFLKDWIQEEIKNNNAPGSN